MPPTNNPTNTWQFGGSAQAAGAEGGGPGYNPSQPGPYTSDFWNQTAGQPVWWDQAAQTMAGDMYSQIGAAQDAWKQQGQWLSDEMSQMPNELAFQKLQAQQQYGYQQQQFGVQQQQYGLSGQQLQQQQAHLGAQYGFQKQEDVLSGQGIARSIQDILKQYGFTQQQFGIQQKQLGVQQGELNLAHDQARSQLAASGTFGSRGTRGGEELGFGYRQQALNLQKQQLGVERGQAAESEQFALFGQQQAQKQLGLTEAEQKEQYGYSSQQIQDGMQQLALQEKSLGISEAQANTQYTNALKQLGLSNIMSVDQLKQQIAAVAGGGYSAITGMMGQLVQILPFLAGIFTNPNTGKVG